MTLNEVNARTAQLIKSVGISVSDAGTLHDEMVILEGLAAALIASAAIRFNKEPDALKEAFFVGVGDRLRQAVYGKPQ